MVFIEAFINSLKLPSKKAMFKLNRISMDYVVFYLFFLIAIMLIPRLVVQLKVSDGLVDRLPIILKLVYFFMFNYLPLTIAVFIFITILAYIGVFIAKLLNRKLRLQIVWKLIAFTTTIPFLLYMLLSAFYPISDVYLLFAMLYSLILLTLMILKFPQRRKKISTNKTDSSK